MKPALWITVVALAVGWVAAASAQDTATSAVLRTQTIQLQAGWNAVFLQVTPLENEPEKVFANLPVDAVATYWPVLTPVQFIDDPEEATWKKPGWGVWYAPSRTDAFLSSLGAVFGNHGYLIHATQSCEWSVEGKVVYRPLVWQPNSFNLVGFSLDAVAPPLFATVFRQSAFAGQRFYRLVNDSWVQVTEPDTTAMRSGEAYWVYCRGKADAIGPVQVTFQGAEQVDFGTARSDAELEFTNLLSDPVGVTVQVLAESGTVPLARVATAPENPLQRSYEELQATTDLTIAGRTADTLVLNVRRERMTLAEQSTLLKVTTGAGTVFWIPVRARRADLAE